MTIYVMATRWERGWELNVKGVGVTQSTTLAMAEEMVREFIAVRYDLDAVVVPIEIIVKRREPCVYNCDCICHDGWGSAHPNRDCRERSTNDDVVDDD